MEDAVIGVVFFSVAGLVIIIGMVLKTLRQVSADRVRALEANTNETSALQEQVYRLQQTVDSLVWAVESRPASQGDAAHVLVGQEDDGPPPFNPS